MNICNYANVLRHDSFYKQRIYEIKKVQKRLIVDLKCCTLIFLHIAILLILVVIGTF